MKRSALIAVALFLSVSCRQDVYVAEIDRVLTVSPPVSDVGDVPLGSSDSILLTLDSLAGGDIPVRTISITNPNGNHFELVGAAPFDVPAGGSYVLEVTYTPESAGWHRAVVTIISESRNAEITVELRGHGAEGGVSVWPYAFDFGAVDPGAQLTRELNIQNTGELDLVVYEAAFTESEFSVVDSLPVTIEPGDSSTLDIAYDATDGDGDGLADPVTGSLELDIGEFLEAPKVALRGNDCENGLPALYDLDSDGLTSCMGDCDDTRADVNPGAMEVADDVDQDCDGIIDEGTSAYDDDGDGASEDGGDCNDGDPLIGIFAPEVPNNGIDDNCDGTVDQGTTDLDGDGWSGDLDCNDTDVDVHPDGVELADAKDNDCDGIVDEGTTAFDDDGDGYCEIGPCTDGSTPGDCDDLSVTAFDTNPGASEIPDWRDNDCDSVIDEGTTNFDDDGDGYSELGGDCDDAVSTGGAINPGQIEIPGDGIDNDCDGTAL